MGLGGGGGIVISRSQKFSEIEEMLICDSKIINIGVKDVLFLFRVDIFNVRHKIIICDLIEVILLSNIIKWSIEVAHNYIS